MERDQPLTTAARESCSPAGSELSASRAVDSTACARARETVAGAERTEVSRRAFLSAALVGLTRKAPPPLAGELIEDDAATGHAVRDGTRRDQPREERRAAVVVIGGGVAGLSAAWHLTRRGLKDVVVLELASRAGGNARSGENEISRYPWAAHYVPVPDAGSTLLRELFVDLGVLVDGRWDERALCFAPQERLYIHGRWQEGLELAGLATPRDRDQVARFEEEIARWRATGAFLVPRERASADAATSSAAQLDSQSMAAWLDERGFDSPHVQWLVDYACRDDYGARPGDVSAWAGIHYHAARLGSDEGTLTWPEGNGWIVSRLLERLGPTVRAGVAVSRIARVGREWEVTTSATRWRTAAVIFAAPAFVLGPLLGDAARELLGAPPGQALSGFAYSPWLTANLTLERKPIERGFPLAWDNVIHQSPALGYVNATHQSLRTHVPRMVWTYYWALADGSPAANRRWLLAQSWRTLADRVLDDLQRAHPDIRACVSRIDILRLGHGMVRPTVGFLSDALRGRLRAGVDGLFFAHSDVSGLSLFEEAYAGGVRAADQTRAWLGRV